LQKQKQNNTKTAFRNRPHTLTKVFERSCFFPDESLVGPISTFQYFFLTTVKEPFLRCMQFWSLLISTECSRVLFVLFNKNIKTLTLHAVSKKIKTFNTVISFSQHQWFAMHSWNSPHISFFSNLKFWFFFIDWLLI
jgi:hypothetical protein